MKAEKNRRKSATQLPKNEVNDASQRILDMYYDKPSKRLKKERHIKQNNKLLVLGTKTITNKDSIEIEKSSMEFQVGTSQVASAKHRIPRFSSESFKDSFTMAPSLWHNVDE